MLTKSFESSFSIFLLLTLSCFSISAFAEKGHCNYRRYVKALDQSILVCQTIDRIEQCGELLPRDYDRSKSYAVGNKGRKVEFIEGECSLDAVVGICILPDRKFYYYEGDTEDLASGCDRIKGKWEVRRLWKRPT